MSLNDHGVSPLRQTQDAITDTLYCLNVPWEISYGLTKNGRKTRIITTEDIKMEILTYDRIKVSYGGVVSIYQLQTKLIQNYYDRSQNKT